MKKKPDYKTDKNYDHLDLGNAISANECTGLIQVPPENDDEMESYLSIMDYRGPEVATKREEDK